MLSRNLGLWNQPHVCEELRTLSHQRLLRAAFASHPPHNPCHDAHIIALTMANSLTCCLLEDAFCSADLVGQLKHSAILTAVSFRVWRMALEERVCSSGKLFLRYYEESSVLELR